MNNKSNLSVLLNGLIKENPVLVLVLGTCPTLAVTTAASMRYRQPCSPSNSPTWIMTITIEQQLPNSIIKV